MKKNIVDISVELARYYSITPQETLVIDKHSSHMAPLPIQFSEMCLLVLIQMTQIQMTQNKAEATTTIIITMIIVT